MVLDQCLSIQSKWDLYIYVFFDNIFRLDVHYVCMLVQHFEPHGRRFTNLHYDDDYYYYLVGFFSGHLVWPEGESISCYVRTGQVPHSHTRQSHCHQTCSVSSVWLICCLAFFLLIKCSLVCFSVVLVNMYVCACLCVCVCVCVCFLTGICVS